MTDRYDFLYIVMRMRECLTRSWSTMTTWHQEHPDGQALAVGGKGGKCGKGAGKNDSQPSSGLQLPPSTAPQTSAAPAGAGKGIPSLPATGKPLVPRQKSNTRLPAAKKARGSHSPAPAEKVKDQYNAACGQTAGIMSCIQIQKETWGWADTEYTRGALDGLHRAAVQKANSCGPIVIDYLIGCPIDTLHQKYDEETVSRALSSMEAELAEPIEALKTKLEDISNAHINLSGKKVKSGT